MLLSENLDACELEWNTADIAVGVDSTAPYYTQGGDKKYLEEQNTFTPTLLGSTTAGTPTYTQQNGSYYVVGDLVFFDVYITISALGGMVGGVRVGNLPFAVKNVSTMYPSFSIGSISNATFPAGANQMTAKGIPNTQEALFSWIKSGTTLSSVLDTDIAAGFSVRMSGMYIRE